MHDGGIGVREGEAAVLADERSARDSLAPRHLPHDSRVGADLHFGIAAPKTVGTGLGLVLQDRPAHGEELRDRLAETAAHSRTLLDRAAGFVLGLDRHRLTLKLPAI